MAKTTVDGLLRSSARLAYAFYRDQVAAILAARYLLEQRRGAAAAAETRDVAAACVPGVLDEKPRVAARS